MPAPEPAAGASERGLRKGALGLGQSTAIGVASTAPASRLAVTLGWAVAAAGPQALLLVPLAFVPMLFSAWASKQMNRADPDCGASFAWAARAIGPRTGWFFGGWGRVAAGLLAMASLAQVSGQYLFLLLGDRHVGDNATSPAVVLAGIAWIAVLGYLCRRGIKVSASLQVTLVIVEVTLLLLLAVVALVKVGTGAAPAGHAAFSWDWLNPASFASPRAFMSGLLLMVFIYWGWDTTASLNEETADSDRAPGTAGVASTVLLLGTYFVVVLSVQMFAGFGTTGVGLNNPRNVGDVLSPLGDAVFGGSALGGLLSRLLILMILTSSAAGAQAMILPSARTALSMAFHKALPAVFGKVHPRYLTPSFATTTFCAVAAVIYLALNVVSGGNVLADSVTAATFFAAAYLGSTGVACFWFYRKAVRSSARNLWSRAVVPLLSSAALLLIVGWTIYWYADPNQSYSSWSLPFWPHATIGGVLAISIVTALAGLAWMVWLHRSRREFFSGASMRDGYSVTGDDRVVRDRPAVPEAAGAD